MDEKAKEAQPKVIKPKAKSVEQATKPDGPVMINWREVALSIEKTIEEKGWNQIKHRRNPQYLHGLIMNQIIGPLSKSLPKE